MKCKKVIKESYVVKIGEGFFGSNSITENDPFAWSVYSEKQLPDNCEITLNVNDAWEFGDTVDADVAANKYGGKTLKKLLSLEDVDD